MGLMAIFTREAEVLLLNREVMEDNIAKSMTMLKHDEVVLFQE